MAAPKSVTFSDLKKSIQSGNLAPTYILHGEESFFIDELIKLFANIIPDDEQDFNLYTLYGPQITMDAVVSTCLRLPIMAPKQVVILKEAQAIKRDLPKLIPYISTIRPNNQTIFVIAFRGERIENRTLINALGQGGGIIFESKKANDRNLDSYVSGIASMYGLNIEANGLAILKEHLGGDLSKLANEIQKLSMILGRGATITPEAIEIHVGISKDFNNFELVDAIAARNFKKALSIIDYFKRNPKKYPSIPVGATIFNLFANLMAAHFAPDKSVNGIMQACGFKWESQAKSIISAMRNYNAWVTIEVIRAIRQFDTKAKGIGSRQNEYDLLKELIYKIFFATGKI